MNYTLQDNVLPTFFSTVEKNNKFNIGTSTLTSNPITALHYHNMAELGLCLDGTGSTYIENRLYEYKQGCIQILPPNVSHLSKATNGVTSKWVWIHVNMRKLFTDMGLTDPDGVMSLADDTNLLSGVYDENEYPELTRLIKQIITEYNSGDEDSSLLITISICKLLILCKRLKRKSGETRSDGVVIAANNEITPVIEYISENLDDVSGLNETSLAKLINVSVSTLRRQFKQYTGMNPKDFIIHSRMAYAEYLLRKTNLSVLEISLRTGYNEISGFYRTFKSFFEVSPFKYRKNNK